MNKRHLDSVIGKYIEKFAWLNEKDGHNESYKWIAVKNFQSTFDIDATDFHSMLLKACKATENLIDSNQQPFRGLCKYAEYEPETVREMFKVLFTDDGGDLVIRQGKID